MYCQVERAEIDYYGVAVILPREKGMDCHQVRQLRLANQLTSFVEPNRLQEWSS